MKNVRIMILSRRFTGKITAEKQRRYIQWVKKEQEFAEEGLVDHRGQHKREKLLSEAEVLQRKAKLHERQLREKEMENELLKKFRKSKEDDILQGKKRSKIPSDQNTS